MLNSNDFLIFGSPAIEQPEIDEVTATLISGWLGTGPKVARFERDFAAYKGLIGSHAAAVNSCTAALHVSMIAANLQPGDEVITTAMTFCATVNSIIHAGLKPILVDVEADTFNIDPRAIESAITSRTRAILVVHFAGRACNMKAIMAIAEKHDLIVIEDCAHAIETEYYGRKIGTFGDFGCFSFYVTKNVVTGEGGMVIARNEESIGRVKILALHGMTKDAWHRFSDQGFKHYHVVECGFKYNMMDIQAAIGIHQLARVEQNWQRRQEIWEIYQTRLVDLPITLPKAPEDNTRHAYHLYTILIDEQQTKITRDAFLDAMTAHKIGVGVHYLSIAEHPFYQKQFGWRAEDYPNAMKIGRQTVSLPLSANLDQNKVESVINSIHSCLLSHKK